MYPVSEAFLRAAYSVAALQNGRIMSEKTDIIFLNHK